MSFDMDQGELDKEIVFNSARTWWNTRWMEKYIADAGLKLPQFVIVKDETLREGMTVPGRRSVSADELVELGTLLGRAGTREIEVGYVAAVREHWDIAKRLREACDIRQMSHTRSWAPNWKEEIDKVIDCGVDMVNLSGFGATETEKFTQPNFAKDALPDLFAEQVAYSRSQGVFTIFMLSAATMKDTLFDASFRQVSEAGVNRIVLADGYGILTPEVTGFLIRRIKSMVRDDVEIGLHAHNDFGLAMPNCLAAMLAGATVLDGAVNGLGARAGIADSVSLAASLEVLYGIDTGLDLGLLADISQKVSMLFGMPVSPLSPVVGENIYRHETDIHISAMLSGNWFAYNAIRPDVLHRAVQLQFGPSSLADGEMSSVAIKMRNMGMEADRETVARVLERMRKSIDDSSAGYLSEAQLEDIIMQLCTP